ncbi:hypothetical protein [Halobacterium zhouii]|uniref:hypothetical protein n=1 Tax=Halobacterium zhouii TaxID=2902624 RepID=UPI001E4B25D6|nr:hypothetical protein [Halobacterium zhouii]
MTNQQLNRAKLIALILSILLISVSGLALVGSANAQQTPPTTTTETTVEDGENGENGTTTDGDGSIDTGTTVSTIGHVTIHDIRWVEGGVEVDLTLQRDDIIRINEYHDGGGYWDIYRLDAGTHTIHYDFRESTDEIGVSVKSEREWKNFTKGTRFVMPGANEVATLIVGVVTVFILLAAITLRRRRKREQDAKQVF